MRAPFRRQTHLIGAKWLRDGSGNDRNSATDETWNGGNQMDTTPRNQGLDLDGENQGSKTDQSKQNGADNNFSNSKETRA